MVDRTHTDEFNTPLPGGAYEAPTGNFRCKITDVKLRETCSRDALIEWFLTVLDGQHKGMRFEKRMVITEQSLDAVKADIQALGYTGEVTRFDAEIPKYIGQDVEVERRQVGIDDDGRPWIYTFFNGLIKIH